MIAVTYLSCSLKALSGVAYAPGVLQSSQQQLFYLQSSVILDDMHPQSWEEQSMPTTIILYSEFILHSNVEWASITARVIKLGVGDKTAMDKTVMALPRDWMCPSHPPNSYLEALTLSVMVFGGGASGR